MEKSLDFIKYALKRAKPESVPGGAVLAIPLEQVGTAASGPWEYLFGTTGKLVTAALLEERFKNYYKKHGWSREVFDEITKDWVKDKKYSTDCEGLLDSFLKLDVTANYCYSSWCTEKGDIASISREWQYGEAVFRDQGGQKVHIGWICGFLGDEPLVVEAKGLRYGVIVTKLSEGSWTHRGLVTKKLDYTAYEITYRYELTNPRQKGVEISALQDFLNITGYTDDDGKLLVVDGTYGPKTDQAFKRFLAAHVVIEPAPIETHTVTIMTSPLTVIVDGEELHS